MENIEIGKINKGQVINLNKIKRFYKRNSIFLWIFLVFGSFIFIDCMLVFKFIKIITVL